MTDSIGTGRVVLNEGYYLNNFLILLDFVYGRYKDLLSADEIGFVNDFKTLSVGAQRLYVRLISRKGPFFRADKLNYSDIGPLDAAVNELIQKGFMLKNPTDGIAFAFDTLTKPELEVYIKTHAAQLNVESSKFTRREDLLEFLFTHEEALLADLFYKSYSLLYPLYAEHIILFKLLFFGNVYQDLSEFILEDLGVMKFEPYAIRDEDRYFTERKVADDTLLISQLRAELYMSVQSGDLDSVLSIGEFLKSYGFHVKLKSKVEKSYTEIGRFIEKSKQPEAALSYYTLSRYPPSRERQIRILDKAGETDKALEQCLDLLHDTHNDDEREFAEQFSEGLRKKLGLAYQKKTRESFTSEVIEADIDKTIRIEEFVLNRYMQEGYSGFYSENGIWKALFALLFWDVMFMPVPEVFFNPFQRGPVDLFTSEFRSKRNTAFEQRMAELQTANLQSIVSDMYKLKYTTANALINWKYLDPAHLDLITGLIPRSDILAVMDLMSNNLKDLKTGFPDLVVFDPEKLTYCLVEVKGPGDQLRPNQKRMLRFFEHKSIPYKVLYVKAKSMKKEFNE